MYVYVYTLLIGHDILVHNSDSLHTGYLMITLSVYHSYIANTARTQCITAFNNHFCCIAASVTFLHILFCVRLLIIMYLHHSLVLLHKQRALSIQFQLLIILNSMWHDYHSYMPSHHSTCTRFEDCSCYRHEVLSFLNKNSWILLPCILLVVYQVLSLAYQPCSLF